MQNALTSAEKSKTTAATDWISIPDLKLEIRMFFQNALNLLKFLKSEEILKSEK